MQAELLKSASHPVDGVGTQVKHHARRQTPPQQIQSACLQGAGVQCIGLPSLQARDMATKG